MLCGVRHGVISGADMFESGAPTVQPGACKAQFTAKEGKVTDCSLYSHRNWFLLTFYKYGMSISKLCLSGSLFCIPVFTFVSKVW